MLVAVTVPIEVCVNPKSMQFLPFNHFLPFHHSHSLNRWLENVGVQGPVLGAEGFHRGRGWFSPDPHGAHQ